MTRSFLVLGVVVAGVLMFWPRMGATYPVHRRLFKSHYKQAVTCGLCHSAGGGTARNSYALDWQVSGESLESFKMIESDDSDGDGLSNIVEIYGGSNPGNERSTPFRPGKRWQRVKQIPAPLEQLKLVLGQFDSVQPDEYVLTEKQVKEIEKQSGHTLSNQLRLPTFYFALKAGKKQEIATFVHFEFSGELFSLLVGMSLDGTLLKLAVFRSGNDMGSLFIPYLKCLKGHGKSDVPGPGEAGCPSIPGRKKVQSRIVLAIRQMLWTVSTLFSTGQ